MRKVIMALIYVFFILGTITMANAGTNASEGNIYYVSPGGSDFNPGTLQKPWRTPGYGSKHLDSGDTLIIRKGTYVLDTYYEDMITPLNSGSPQKWITIKGEYGAKPILKGKNNLFSAVDLSGKNYIRIENLEITNYQKAPFREGIDAGDPISHIIIKNVYIHHLDEFGINFADANHIKIENSKIRYCGFGSIGGPAGKYGGWRNILISGCDLSYSGHYYQGGDGSKCPYDRPDGFGIEPSQGPIKITKTIATHNKGDGLDSKAANTIISRSIVANNFADGIKLWNTACKIENCLIYGRGDGKKITTPWSPIVISSLRPFSKFEIINSTIDDYLGNNYLITVQYDNPHIPINIKIINSIFSGRGNNSPLYLAPSTNYYLRYNLFWMPRTDHVISKGTVQYHKLNLYKMGVGNSYRDPKFLKPAFGTTGNYYLAGNSPAIDTGTSFGAPYLDLKGNKRPINLRYDKGAYEYIRK